MHKFDFGCPHGRLKTKDETLLFLLINIQSIDRDFFFFFSATDSEILKNQISAQKEAQFMSLWQTMPLIVQFLCQTESQRAQGKRELGIAQVVSLSSARSDVFRFFAVTDGSKGWKSARTVRMLSSGTFAPRSQSSSRNKVVDQNYASSKPCAQQHCQDLAHTGAESIELHAFR